MRYYVLLKQIKCQRTVAAPAREYEKLMAKNIHKLWNLFFYAGVERAEYKKLLPGIREENRVLLKLFSQLAAVMFLILFIVSTLTNGFITVNSSSYLLCGIEMLFILFCSHFILPKYPMLVSLLVYIFEIMLYIFGIHISMLHADMPAVSAVAFLLVSPLLFYDQPIRLTALIAAVVTGFCLIATNFKTPEIAQTDVWNSITFGIVAVAATVFTMTIKIRSLAQSRQIVYLSQTDLKKKKKNRNHYESRLQKYPEMCRTNLICVYADVNGLHEMNNQKGHPEGDKMLRAVADEMLRYFDLEHTYRVGGDEFIAFRPDGRPENLPLEIEQIRRALAEKGYHLSLGTSVRSKSGGRMDMLEIVSEAESRMYADKKEFYSDSENDRRSR